MTHRLFLGLCLLLLAGCTARTKPRVAIKAPAAPAHAVAKPTVARPSFAAPILDIFRGGAGLPLEISDDLTSQQQLVQGLRKGYERRIDLKESRSWITLDGADPRRLDLLKIDLTNQAVREDFTATAYERPSKLEPGIRARQFEYLARPLLYRNGATQWRISASDARFSLLRDKAGRETLILSDAREGSFEFSVLLADISPMLLGAISKRSAFGFVARNIEVEFTSQNPRNLVMDLRMKGSMLLVPATVQIHGRLDIDEACNVRFTELTCTGEDAGGAMMAAFAEPALKKQQRRVAPLVSWPGNRIVVKDVHITVDEALRIRGEFGRAPSQLSSAE